MDSEDGADGQPPEQQTESGRVPRELAPANATPGDAGDSASLEPRHSLKEKAFRELKRFAVMFLYLWIVLGLFVLNESIILAEHHINYKDYGFAFMNALVLAKVMLVADDMRLGSRFKDRPLVYSILIKSFLFAVVFIAVHVLEKIIAGWFEGKTITQSIPAIGGGSLMGVLLVGIILSVSLIPFFAFTEVSRVMERGELAKLIFSLDAKSDQRPRVRRPS